MKSHEYAESTKGREIEISMKETFPISVRIVDDFDVVGNYKIVKTKADKFMLQK